MTQTGDTGLFEPHPFDVSTFGLTPSGGEPELGYVVSIGKKGGGVKSFALVSAADYPWVSKYRWGSRGTGYIYRHESRVTEGFGTRTLHRDVLGLPKGDSRQGEHRNRCRWDNRRSNLRVVNSQHENLQNVPARKGFSSRHRGVWLNRRTGRWAAEVICKRRKNFLGYHATEEEAAQTVASWRRENLPYANDERFDRA